MGIPIHSACIVHDSLHMLCIGPEVNSFLAKISCVFVYVVAPQENFRIVYGFILDKPILRRVVVLIN